MIDLYAIWIINGQGQVNGNDSAGLGSFIIDTLQESDTHGHRGKIFSELDNNLLFLHTYTNDKYLWHLFVSSKNVFIFNGFLRFRWNIVILLEIDTQTKNFIETFMVIVKYMT